MSALCGRGPIEVGEKTGPSGSGCFPETWYGREKLYKYVFLKLREIETDRFKE